MIRRLARAIAPLLLALGLAPQAQAAAPLGFDDARHLLNRTSWAASPDEILAFAQLTREQAVDRLFAWTGRPAATPMPEALVRYEPLPRVQNLNEEERRAFQQDQFRKAVALKDWWMTELLVTPSPLTEKMTLFWHNHFVSSLQKVRLANLMVRQNQLLRRHALGNFGELLHAVSKDPAMVVYLDIVSNRKGQPNENFAREVMELFTLGEGNYTERDIKEAARAFTGWSIERETGEFVFRRMLHDDGPKTVLGRTGNFDGDAVLDILLAQPQTAELVVAKLWREFVSPTPDPAEVRRIARVFRDSRYDVKAALRAILTSDAFYAPANRAALVKSPVDLVVGTLRQFRFETGEVTPLMIAVRQLGQDIFTPPNVKGWPGGDAWINATTLLARKQLLERLFRAEEMAGPMRAAMAQSGDFGAPKALAKGGDEMRARLVKAMTDIRFDSRAWLAQFRPGEPIAKVVLAAEPANPLPAGAQGMELVRALVLDPVYQLK
jgi:uncharacterized protein (DUF1800 family)